MATPTSTEHRLAVFIDFENLAHGFQNKDDGAFEIERVFDRLVEKGKILVKRAYCDWHRYRRYTKELHEAGVELIEIPNRSMTGKNSADIRLVVDAMDLASGKDHIDTFVIVSGDSDFSPLVAKLKENGKSVTGVGMRESTSKLLADHCDEFLFYEDLAPDSSDDDDGSEGSSAIPADKREVWLLLFASIRALHREGYDVPYSSQVKDTMKRKRPSFSESGAGYRSFSDLLEDVEEAGYIGLRTDDRSGTYVVTKLSAPGGRRRRRRGGRGSGSTKSDGGNGESQAASSAKSKAKSKAKSSTKRKRASSKRS